MADFNLAVVIIDCQTIKFNSPPNFLAIRYVMSASLVVQAEYNMEQRKILLSLAKVEMRRQELRQQAKEVRGEVMIIIIIISL